MDRNAGPLTIVEREDPWLASDAPLAICHPFPGRTLKPHPLLAGAYHETQQWMARWQEWSEDCVTEHTMVRPLATKGAQRLRASYETHWQDAQPPWGAITLNDTKQPLEYGPCYAVKLGPLREVWRNRLQDSGVTFTTDIDPKAWTGRRILCPGRGLAEWFPNLGVTVEGGELLTCEGPAPETLLSGGGAHLAPTSDGSVVLGATRWPADQEPPTLHAHVDELLVRGRALWPNLGAVNDAWRGVRAISDGERLPIAGRVPGKKDTFVLGALGAKGLLWGPLAAQCLVAHILDGTPVPHALSATRYPDTAWVDAL